MIKKLFKLVFLLFFTVVLLVAGTYVLNLLSPQLFMKVFTKFVPMEEIKKKVAKEIQPPSGDKIQKFLKDKVKKNAGGFSLKGMEEKLKNTKLPYLKDEHIKIRKFTARDFQMEVGEKDFAEYLHSLGGMENVSVEFMKGMVAVNVPVEVLGKKINVQVQGHFTVEQKTKVRFVGDKLLFGKASVPGSLQKEILESVSPVVDFGGFDVPLTIKEVKIFQDYFVVSGSIRGT